MKKNKVAKLKKDLKIYKGLSLIFGFIICGCITIMMYLCALYTKDMETISQLNDAINIKESNYNNSIKYMSDLEITVKELNSQLIQVQNTNKSYVDELTELRSREELYDKYKYAIINETGERTELKYEEIKLGEQLMREKGYNPHLMFGTIMVESGGDPSAINESSGATGYGQFLNSTAEFVWTDLLHNSSYSPEVMKDGQSNIKMMAEYYEYLYKQKGNTFGVVKQYSGNLTDEGTHMYLARINNYTSKSGVIIE